MTPPNNPDKAAPMAEVVESTNGEEWRVCVGPYIILGEGFRPKEFYESLAYRINVAFRARVDEEVKKAVEAFRERAADVCLSLYTIDHAPGDWPTPEQCADAIRALPLEADKEEGK